MKRKSNKRKKPQAPKKDRGSWLSGFGTFLAGIAAVAEVIFQVVSYLLGR